MRSMERATPESIPRIKFDSDEVTNLLGPSERVDPKTGWRWYDHPSTSSSSSSWQAASWWKSSSWNERCFSKGLNVFSLTKRWRFHGKHTRTQCHVPAHVIFSRNVPQLVLSASLTCATRECGSRASWLKRCVLTKTFVFTLSAATQHTFSDDFVIIEHFVTSHLHSNPPFAQTINGTSADFIF